MHAELNLADVEGRATTVESVGEWLTVDQKRIDLFADATEDHQWLHVDTARAVAESPYGATIAHGFLTLSLIGYLLRETLAVTGVRMAVNYGLEKVRFTSAVPAGSRIRGRFSVKRTSREHGATKVVWGVVVEREGEDKPCCIAEWIVLYYADE